MSDLERELRELFDHDEARLSGPSFAPSGPPPHLRARARHRQALTIGTAALIVTALAGGAMFGLRSLEPRTLPASTVERTVNGVMMSIPEDWHLVDPVDAGIEPPPTGGSLPDLIAILSDASPGSVVRCPGESPSSVLLTVQQRPLALDGEAATPWPVELEPMPRTVDAGCYAGWEMSRAAWTASGRTFEARVGTGPEADDATIDALMSAFASMTFAEVEGSPASIEIASGTSDHGDWRIVVSGTPDDTQISFEDDNGASGFGIGSASLIADTVYFGAGEDRRALVFGLARDPITRIDLVPLADPSGVVASADVVRLPAELADDVTAFFLEVPASSLPANARGIDPDGDVIDEWLCGGAGLDDAKGQPVLAGGPPECPWTLYAAERADGRAALTVAADDGTSSATIRLDPEDAGMPLRLTSFGCGEGQPILVFGVASDDVARIEWLVGSEPAWSERTQCMSRILAPGTCVLFELRSGPGTAVAYDDSGARIGRTAFG